MGLFDNFSGGKSQRQVAGGYKAFRDQATGSARNAQGMLDTGYGDAQGRFDQFDGLGASGMAANRLYSDAMGINGADPRMAAFQTFESDPFREFANQNTDQAIQDVFRRYNAGGLANSGVNRHAVGQVAGEFARGDVNQWLNRLMGLGDQNIGRGLQIAGSQAGLDTGLANRKAGIETNLGNALAHSHVAHAGFDAANNNTGMNNLLNLVGAGANIASKFIKPMPIG
jgi:hypothetical protein